MDVGITNNGKTYFDHKTKLYKKSIKNGVPINCGIIIFTKDCTIYKESLSFLEDTLPKIKIDKLYEKPSTFLRVKKKQQNVLTKNCKNILQ